MLDEDSSGDIDYRELITGLEYFKDTGVDEKLKGKNFLESKKVNNLFFKFSLISVIWRIQEL